MVRREGPRCISRSWTEAGGATTGCRPPEVCPCVTSCPLSLTAAAALTPRGTGWIGVKHARDFNRDESRFYCGCASVQEPRTTPRFVVSGVRDWSRSPSRDRNASGFGGPWVRARGKDRWRDLEGRAFSPTRISNAEFVFLAAVVLGNCDFVRWLTEGTLLRGKQNKHGYVLPCSLCSSKTVAPRSVAVLLFFFFFFFPRVD